MKLYLQVVTIFILMLSFTFTMAQSPIGWASANGGTTGGEGGSTVVATTRSELVNYASSPSALIIQIEDTIDLTLYEMVKVKGNKTIEGVGHTGAIRYGGLQIEGNNVIVRNLEIWGSYDGDWDGKTHSTDGLVVYGAQNVWVDHCWFHTCADGLLDIRSVNENNVGDFVTVSYCKFTDHNKVMLIGSSDNSTFSRDHLNVTIHHCWFDGTVEKGVHQRMPRIRFGDIHIYNTFYEDIGFYCAAANFESDLVVENNWYRQGKNPFNIGNIGEGIKDPSVVAAGNVFEYSGGDQVEMGDAFDPSAFYSYSLDNVNTIPGNVMNFAGPENNPENQAPVAVTDEVDLVNLNALVILEPLLNDTDDEIGTLRLAVVTNQPQGTFGIQKDRILYTPNKDYSGVDTIMYELVDTEGGVDTGMVLVNYPPVGIFNTENETTSIKVFPNPAQNLVNVEILTDSKSTLNYGLYDLYGTKYLEGTKEVNNFNKAVHFNINVQSLESGNYILMIEQNNTIISEKIQVIK